MKQEYILSLTKTNLYAFVLLIPIGLVVVGPYVFIHGVDSIRVAESGLIDFFGGNLGLALVFLAGILVHELLHGIAWAIFAKNGWRSVSFGIKISHLTPYCHCSEALKKKQFIIGVILPCIVLGIIPIIYSYCAGSLPICLFGYFFTASAGGDLMVLWMLRKVDNDHMIKDHPEQIGFIVEEIAKV